MFKFAVMFRNFSLFASIAVAFLAAYHQLEITIYSATMSGTVLFVLQYIVNTVGTNMMSNNKNRRASSIKKALVSVGFTLTEDVTAETVSRKYHSKAKATVLMLLPLAFLFVCATQFYFVHEPYWLLGVFICASLTTAIKPVYLALIEDEPLISES